ncbi:MAG: hypothetical protein PSN44_07860 [Gammaproteobacteria bacterium]|nr:hypothetical protein [Gammaproteobacteria bacterium]
MEPYQPPFTITPAIIALISEISENLGRLSVLEGERSLRLRRINRIRTIMGRLWQTLILSQWNPLLAQLPVESMIHEHQRNYYQAINHSTQQTDSAPFIEFMLSTILDTIKVNLSPQVTPQVTPQVKLLLDILIQASMAMSRDEIQTSLKLKDRKSFRERYLKPALDKGLIEMTIPDKPNSRLQKYAVTGRGKREAKSK